MKHNPKESGKANSKNNASKNIKKPKKEDFIEQNEE